MTDKSQAFRRNHYVPVWYQKRFLLPGKHKYFRLDINPDSVKENGVTYTRNNIHEWSPRKVFVEKDLYTTQWGNLINTDIEARFFGKIDHRSKMALEYFSGFDCSTISKKSFHNFLNFMSIQKLRTPKGLNYIASLVGGDKNKNLVILQDIQNMFCAVWTESVWQIASAEKAGVKLIISDHPVTVYNRKCPPLSKYCVNGEDPDVRLAATHTYFPLDLNKVLILTNLNWVRNPYQNELRIRPNPQWFRDSIFNFTKIQTDRYLTDDEVLQLNYITKKRALRYVAAAEKEWLFPEKYVSTDHWKKLGGGFLLMPEPRLEHMGGEIVIGYKSGSSDAFGPYGHKPWQKGYKDSAREQRERNTLERFKAEWASIHGPKYTARTHDFGSRTGLDSDSEEMTQIRESVLKKYSRKRRRK